MNVVCMVMTIMHEELLYSMKKERKASIKALSNYIWYRLFSNRCVESQEWSCLNLKEEVMFTV